MFGGFVQLKVRTTAGGVEGWVAFDRVAAPPASVRCWDSVGVVGGG